MKAKEFRVIVRVTENPWRSKLTESKVSRMVQAALNRHLVEMIVAKVEVRDCIEDTPKEKK